MIDCDALLKSIALVESESEDSAIGRKGERGRYQITEGVWYSHSSLPYTSAHNFDCAHRVAGRHLAYLVSRLAEPTPLNVALAWNAGVRGLKKPTKSSLSYAQRVINLYEDFTRRSHSKNPTASSFSSNLGAIVANNVPPPDDTSR